MNDALGQAIHHAMQQEDGRAAPPDRVWRRINSQIRGGPTRPRRRLAAPSRGGLLAPLVQGLAVMVLVLLVGLNMVPYVHVAEQPAPTVESTPLPAADSGGAGPASLPGAQVAAGEAVENVDIVKANLRQQQRQLQEAAGRAGATGAQQPAGGQGATTKNSTAAVQPSEENYWSPPRPRPPAPVRVLPKAPRF